MLTQEQNTQTQRLVQHKVFNNWDVITKGWYTVCKVSELKVNEVKSFDINQQKICVFRNSKGNVHAMDGFCSHMGVDLGIGKVVGDRVRCFFHHWEYDQNGQCQHIPAQTEIPKKACLTTYQTSEKYGFIWVYTEKQSEHDVLDIPELEGAEVVFKHGKSYYRGCHHHITMINGIDPQHLSTVHDIHMDMEIDIHEEDKNIIDIELKGKTPSTKFSEKIIKKVLGDNYAYSMKYADGCVAALSVMKGVSLFGRKNILPTLHMIFAYQTVKPGKTFVQPIFVTKKRSGVHGKLISGFWLFVTKMAFNALQGEDGKVYENIRFSTSNLLPMDSPVAKYISYINRLEPSKWSRHYES